VTAATKRFTSDPIKFFWVDKAKYPTFVDEFQGANVVVLKGKRKKYYKYEGEMTSDGLVAYISHIVSGGGDAIKLDLSPEMIEKKADL
jgi:hypothetical protein